MTRLLSIGSVLILVLAACNIAVPDTTPTPEILITETATADTEPTVTPSSTASITPTAEVDTIPVVVASPIPTRDDFNPVLDVTPTPTQGPCEVEIQSGETLTMALNREPCGNQVTNGLVAAVVTFNENITNADLVSPGLRFFVPLPSPTPVPQGADMTETALAQSGNVIVGSSVLPDNTVFDCYTVQEGDRVVDITLQFGTTLEILRPLNPNLNWSGCDFTNPSGGPDCSPNITIGQCVVVPFPTPTPVPTTTPSGRETATPTPTQEAAIVISPPEGALASQRVELQWVSVGILAPNEVYLIDVEDRTAGMATAYTTRNTRLVLPDELIPTDGITHTIAWRVRVARVNADGSATPIGGVGEWNTYQWQSR